MNFFKEWENLKEDKIQNTIPSDDEISKAIEQESSSQLQQLKLRLKYKMFWGIGFIILFSIWMFLDSTNRDIVNVLTIFIITYLTLFIILYIQYIRLDLKLDMSSKSLLAIRQYYRIIKQTLSIEEIWAIAVFPIAICGGIAIGVIYGGGSLIELSTDTTVISLAIVLISILTPLGFLSTRKLNKIAFGGLLSQLKENIKLLEEP